MSLINAKPIVGILTGEGGSGKIFNGDGQFFKAIQHKAREAGSFCYVFTLNGVKPDQIEGLIYSRNKQQWAKIACPYPDLIYNRLSTRKEEGSPLFQKFKERIMASNIPFFNPFFFDKWNVHQVLSRELSAYLPESQKMDTAANLSDFLSNHPKAYLKPVKNSQGNGIYRIQSHGTFLDLTSLDGISERFHIQHSAEKMAPFFNDYMIQEEIAADTLYGRKYDLRVIALLNKNDFLISGIGIRLAGNNYQLTTHVPNGGFILPFELIADRVNLKEMQILANSAGHALASAFGLIGEFSMDIGLTSKGPIIYEVNSKPMSFDEVHIQEHRINQLVSLFLQLSKGTSSLRSQYPLR
ncbi:YheC/YheD family protein [Bacillus sp. PAMC26568]|nr:YheC/YheD family protein [Bacillus sp. PAMC26568]